MNRQNFIRTLLVATLLIAATALAVPAPAGSHSTGRTSARLVNAPRPPH
jgi:hypothetical protein